MKQSKKIALCGISAALGSIFLILVRIVPTGKLSLFALSSVALMLPISKDLYGYSIITMLATALIAFFTGGITIFLPYIIGFGLHPLIYTLLEKFNFKYSIVVKIIIKLIYFNIVLYALYSLAYLAKLLLVDIEFYILALLASPVFIAYDFLMIALQKRIRYLLDKYVRF